jgi:hypothetical protein
MTSPPPAKSPSADEKAVGILSSDHISLNLPNVSDRPSAIKHMYGIFYLCNRNVKQLIEMLEGLPPPTKVRCDTTPKPLLVREDT